LVNAPPPTGGGSQQIVILPAAGVALIVPLAGKFSRIKPAVSPDGTRLAFDETPPHSASRMVYDEAAARKLIVTDPPGGPDGNDGEFINPRAFPTIAPLHGQLIATQVPDCEAPQWIDAAHVRLSRGATVRRLAITDAALQPFSTGYPDEIRGH